LAQAQRARLASRFVAKNEGIIEHRIGQVETMRPGAEITKLILEWQRGNRSAEQDLFEALYQSLHTLAIQCLRNERPDQTLSATALVHEAYLRFTTTNQLKINDRSHFLALAARVMRRVVVDKARARKSDKRGGDFLRVGTEESIVSTDEDADRILDVDRALEALSLQSPRQGQLIELRFFAGFKLDEAAQVLGISTRTARREWQVARTRLRGVIDGTARTG